MLCHDPGCVLNTDACVQEAVRDFLPRELKGFLPKSSSFGTSTFELPSVAFAYERGWRQVVPL